MSEFILGHLYILLHTFQLWMFSVFDYEVSSFSYYMNDLLYYKQV